MVIPGAAFVTSTTCSWLTLYNPWSAKVFPTPVGVFPRSGDGSAAQGRLPHARGGVPQIPRYIGGGRTSSPRPWGCSDFLELDEASDPVFPTPVGVFRKT